MRLLKIVSAMIIVVMTSVVALAGTAGIFRLPFDPNQRWSTCGSIGWKMPPDLVFMQLNTNNGRFHAAEDWNGVCGGSSDFGAVLYAVADGVVDQASDTTATDGYGKLLLIRHPLPDGMSRYLLYEHISNIEINPRTGVKFRPGDQVFIGETVARLGDGNGSYLGAAHLHFEMRRDGSFPLQKDPYYNPLTVATALRYSSPRLFIDDRRQPFTIQMASGDWTYMAWDKAVPSSTAFVEYNGERYSIPRAVSMGLIHNVIYKWVGSGWYAYSNVADVFFDPGVTHAMWALVGGLRLTVLIPGDQFRTDRAKLDVLQAAARDGRPTAIRTDLYNTSSENLTGDPNWEYRWIKFDSNFGLNTVTMSHVTYKSNPFLRYTMYCGPDGCGPWVIVNMNTLD